MITYYSFCKVEIAMIIKQRLQHVFVATFIRIVCFGVEGRTRTDDIQNHNLTL